MEDTAADAEWLAAKTVAMRIFPDGNRPSYINAAGHELAVPLYELYCRKVAELLGKPTQTGRFGADMQVSLVNDGPVTIVIDSPTANQGLKG